MPETEEFARRCTVEKIRLGAVTSESLGFWSKMNYIMDNRGMSKRLTNPVPI